MLSERCCQHAGGGVTQIVMPYMTEGIAKHVPEYEAWRWAFFLPGCLYIIITFLILTLGQVFLRCTYCVLPCIRQGLSMAVSHSEPSCENPQPGVPALHLLRAALHLTSIIWGCIQSERSCENRCPDNGFGCTMRLILMPAALDKAADSSAAALATGSSVTSMRHSSDVQEDDLCLRLQDCPDGNYASLERSGKKQKSKPWRELYNGFCNYRMWGLAACYAYSFGVEVCYPTCSCLSAQCWH